MVDQSTLIHFLRELAESWKVELVCCASKNNVADMFTKGFNIKQLRQITRLLNPLTKESTH